MNEQNTQLHHEVHQLWLETDNFSSRELLHSLQKTPPSVPDH